MPIINQMFILFLLIPPFLLVVHAQTITRMIIQNHFHMFQTYQVPYQPHPAPARPQLLIRIIRSYDQIRLL